MWCRDVTEILESNDDRLQGMKDFEQRSFKELNELAALVRGNCCLHLRPQALWVLVHLILIYSK